MTGNIDMTLFLLSCNAFVQSLVEKYIFLYTARPILSGSEYPVRGITFFVN